MMANSRRSSEKKSSLNLLSWFGGGSKEDDEEGRSLSKHNAKLSSLSQPTPTLIRMTSHNETTMVEPGNLASKNSMVSADSAQSSITNSWAPPKFRRYCPPPSFQHSDAPIENMVITVKKKGAGKARKGDVTLPPVVEDSNGGPNVSDQRVFKNYGKRVSSNEKPNNDAPETKAKNWFFWSSSHINRNDDVTSDINTYTSRDWTVKSIDPVSPKIIEESILELQETLGMEVKCLDDIGTNSQVTAKETFRYASEYKHGEDDKTLKNTADWLGKISEIRVSTHNGIGQLCDNANKLPDQKRNSVQEQLKAFHRPMRMDYSNDSEMFTEIESSINEKFHDIRNQMLTSGLSLREIAAFFHGIALMTAQVRSIQLQSANEKNDTSLDHFRTPSFRSRGSIHEVDSSLQNIEPILVPGGDHLFEKTNEQMLIETQNDCFAGNSGPKVGNHLNEHLRNEKEFAGQPDNTDNHNEWSEIAISVVDSDDSNRLDNQT